jgi:hypothetical protein
MLGRQKAQRNNVATPTRRTTSQKGRSRKEVGRNQQIAPTTNLSGQSRTREKISRRSLQSICQVQVSRCSVETINYSFDQLHNLFMYLFECIRVVKQLPLRQIFGNVIGHAEIAECTHLLNLLWLFFGYGNVD